MNDVIFVPAEQKAVVMVPLEAVKADLVTKQEHTIFVPLADDYNYGVVKVGAGLNFSAGVVSLNNDAVLDLISKTPYVSYGEKQNLTEDQMRQARDNIRAGDSGFSGYYKDLIGKLEIATNEEAKEGVVVDKAINPFQLRDALKDVDLSTKVDKVTENTDNVQLYAKEKDGTQTMLNAVQYYPEDRNGIARFINGNLIVNTPTQDAHATNKKYVDDRFNGANKAVSFINYSAMISSLNALGNTSYSVGQNIMIVTLAVPDLWVSEVAETSVAYTYVSDDDFVNELTTNGYVQVGYYKLSALETQKVDLTDYATVSQVNSKVQQVSYSKDQTFADGSDAGAIGRLYMRFRDNTENSIVAHCQSVRYTVPVRDSTGNFYVGDPTQVYHCVNLRTIRALEGEGAPTESTVAKFVGQLYYDTTNNKTYQCTAIDTTNKVYAWVRLIRETDYAGNSVKGVVDVRAAFGMQTDQWGRIQTVKATDAEIIAKTNEYHPLVSKNVDQIVKTGMSTNTLEWSDEEKVNARNLIGSASTEIASNTYSAGKYTGTAGLFMFDGGGKGGLFKSTTGGDGADRFRIKKASFSDIQNRTASNYHDAGIGNANHCCPITPANFDYAFKMAFLNDKLNGYVYNNVDYTWTEEEKKTARAFLEAIGKTEYATYNTPGVVIANASLGTQVSASGYLQIVPASETEIKDRSTKYKPIVPSNLDYAVVSALTNNSITLTDEQKAQVRSFLQLDEAGTANITFRRWS